MAIYRPPAEDNGSQTNNIHQVENKSGGPQDKPPRSNNLSRRRSSQSLMIDYVHESRTFQAFNKMRLLCGDIVNHPKVQMLIIVLIVVNAVMMGIATFDFVTENPAVDHAFEKTDWAFLLIFTIELGMQFIYRGYTLFMDGWLVFDFLIVVLSWAFASLQIIRAFRIFRALRIITRIENMRDLVAA